MDHRKIATTACFSATLALAGCAISPQKAAMTSSYDLCYLIAVTPAANINRKVRIEELNRRGEDCSRFQDSIRQQVATENAVQEQKARESLQYQRQLELEKARAPQVTIQNTPAPSRPSSYQCRRVGDTTYCDGY